MNTENPVLENATPVPRKPIFNLTNGDTAFTVSAVVVCIFASLFGFFSGFAFGYMLSALLMFAVFAVYFAKSFKLKLLPIIFGLLSLANTVVFITTSNGWVRFFAFVLSFLLGFACFDSLIHGSPKGNFRTFGIFTSAFMTIGNIGISMRSIFTSRKSQKRVFPKILLGLACALPIILIVVPLLIASDDAFSGMMDKIGSAGAAPIFKSIFGISISIFVISYGFSLKNGSLKRVRPIKLSGIENIYVISFLSSISVCYLLYLFSQLAYFFSAFSGFLPGGKITYAEYARKGFFEMCAIAVINLILIFATLIFAKKTGGKMCGIIKAIATFISLFTLMIIATAISKMVLYINTYGMTVKRLTTSAFMVFLAIVFLSVILRIFVKKINIMNTALAAAGCIVVLLGTFNVNSVCAKYNYESYVNKRLNTIDINAIYELGDEGVPYIVKLSCVNDEVVALEAQDYLSSLYTHDYFENIFASQDYTVETLKPNAIKKGFEKYSIPNAKAYSALYEFIEKNPTFPEVYRERIEAAQSYDDDYYSEPDYYDEEYEFPPDYYTMYD